MALKKGELPVNELLKGYKEGNLKYRDIIIKRYVKYVDWAVIEFRDFYLSEEDLYQTSYEGLLNAIERAKPESTNPFPTKVKNSIISNILNEVKNHLGISGLSIDLIELMKKIKNCKKSLEIELERIPSTEEIIEELGLESKLIKKAITTEHLIESVSPRNFEGFMYPITGTSLRTTEQEVLFKEMSTVLKSEIDRKLTLKERYIIVLKYINGIDLTNEEIGNLLETSGSYVSYLENKALSKLKWYRRGVLTGYIKEIEEYNDLLNPVYKLK